MAVRFTARLDTGGSRGVHAPLVAWPLLFVGGAWLLLEIAVGLDFARDRYVAYRGVVSEVRNTWTDPLTLDFSPVKHLVIRTPDGRLVDRTVTVAELAHARVAVGDSVVKARGFGERVSVPGKPTVSEMLTAARARLQGVGTASD